MNNGKFLEELLPYSTGDDDNVIDIDIDTLLQTGVGSDYKPINQNPPQETEAEKQARLAREEEEKKKTQNQNQNQNQDDDVDNPTLLQNLNNETLTEDEKSLKKEILDKFKGVSIDKNGNILDKDGVLIVTGKRHIVTGKQIGRAHV